MILMKIVSFADGRPGPYDGQYLERFDPEYDHGLGRIWSTPDPDRAMHFESLTEALTLWKTQSRTRPTRSDGKPNRPMTALTVTFEDMEKGHDSREARS